MRKIFIALAIGVGAGIIDVIPMICQGLDWYANLSAFVHWVGLGLIIPFVHWPLKPWLNGLLIGELTSLPIVIIVLKDDPFSVLPILIFSAILGILVGISGDKFINRNES